MTVAKERRTMAPRLCRCGCGAIPRADARGGFASHRCYIVWNHRRRYSEADEAEIRRLHGEGLGAQRIGDAMTPKRTKGQITRQLRRMGLLTGDGRRFNQPPAPKVAPAPAPVVRAQRSPVGPTLRRNPALTPARAKAAVVLAPTAARAPREYLHPPSGAWTFGCACCTRHLLGPMVEGLPAWGGQRLWD